MLPKIDVLYKSFRLCENHFEAKYITQGAVRKTLKAHAVPSVFPEGLKRFYPEPALMEESQDLVSEKEDGPKKVIILSG